MVFDYIEFHKKLHKSKYANPQFAELKEDEMRVIYSFFLNPTEPNSRNGIHCTDKIQCVRDSASMMTVLNMLDDNLETRVVGQEILSNPLIKKNTDIDMLLGQNQIAVKNAHGNNEDSDVYSYFGELVLTYKARSKEEFDKITAYLRTVPEEDGNLPKPYKTFFGYD